jgi:hypothetical protein
MDHEVRKLTIMISDGFKFILTYDVGDNFFGKKITTLENILITVGKKTSLPLASTSKNMILI